MANKIIKVPVKDVDGLSKDGGYSLRYRIVSKDGNRKSQWSEIVNLNYSSGSAQNVPVPAPLSFYERVYSANNAPILAYYNPLNSSDPNNYLDPHTLTISGVVTQPYDIKTVKYFFSSSYDTYINSGISISKDTEGVLEYKWDSLEKHADFLQQKFDVYLSFRTDTDGWQSWSFAGTTTANTFSFTAPSGPVQYVQAALFISSYPKLDNIYGQDTNFISISTPFNVYRNDDGAVTVTALAAPTGTGAKYTATVSGLTENFPSNGWAGRKVYANATISDTSRTGFPEDTVVRSRNNATSIVVEASTAIPTSTKYNLSLVS